MAVDELIKYGKVQGCGEQSRKYIEYLDIWNERNLRIKKASEISNGTQKNLFIKFSVV